MSNYTDITDIFTESYSEAFETHHEEEGRERRELGRLLEIYDAIASWNEFGAGFYIAIGDNFTHSRRAFSVVNSLDSRIDKLRHIKDLLNDL